MITADEIKEKAGQVQLQPTVVEKDYALGWMLLCYLVLAVNGTDLYWAQDNRNLSPSAGGGPLNEMDINDGTST